ncbi:hypothetical protein HAX54_032549, partial [Datura stramonium]|nr:hypothetical protein [Datura stramonium]
LLNSTNKAIADIIADGSMMNQTFAEASEIFDTMTKTSGAWHTREFEAAKVQVVGSQEKASRYDDYYMMFDEEANFVNNQIEDSRANTQESNQDTWRQ